MSSWEASNATEVLSVWQVNSMIRDVLQQTLPTLEVAGEVADLARPQSGHLYFSLKDDQSVLRAVIWRSQAQRMAVDLSDGMAVVCRGSIDVYRPRGSYQLICQHVQPQGVGQLQQALARLHKKLAAEGLFAEEHKRPLPRFPRWIAVVTSPTGAAIRDFLEVARRRWRHVRITVIPCRVQGEGSVQEIVSAIRAANRWTDRPDLIVATRGGGSLEDLWSFNDERVVRAIYASTIPVISAVGHEIDVTLADLVADRRALTPSEAAELALPDGMEIQANLATLQRRMRLALTGRVTQARHRLESLARRPWYRRPLQIVHDRAARVDELGQRGRRAIHSRLRQTSDRLAAAAGKLNTLSPLAVMARGYCVVTEADSPQLITSIRQLTMGQQVRTRLADGAVLSRVGQINPFDPQSARPGGRPASDSNQQER